MEIQREDPTRISVDSLPAWLRIKANYTRAAIAALDEELVTNGQIQERDALLKHLYNFIDKTFDITRPNLRINGRNFEEVDISEQEEEPFDEGFDRHIWSLAEQSLKWDREIATKRREHPTKVEELMQELLERQRELEDEPYEGSSTEGQLDHDDDAGLNHMLENVGEVAIKINAIHAELKQSVASQLERSQRVQEVADEMKALKP
ncbi:uncharacterized protein FIBRA_08336 [Fibroporia radiculosa]|uniref:Uncharacterized protein n=1 Tax=Fibroporia radiculosa TaxID=599839 RepID=J4H543_9APHY|nr:uncharacterized protein FIBRA_08336 [Fibroporia radiculosa]CCM06089.1 predicted protein [Fibroporia radiculosa]